MTREDKCKLAIEKGFTYDEVTGFITSPTGVKITKITKNGYILLTIRDSGNTYYLYGHQFGWYYKNKQVVYLIDHKNRIKTDNAILNLRELTKSENAMNMNNVKGYSKCKRSNKYVAYIMVDYKKKHLGAFDTPEEARSCYLENKKIHHNIN